VQDSIEHTSSDDETESDGADGEAQSIDDDPTTSLLRHRKRTKKEEGQEEVNED